MRHAYEPNEETEVWKELRKSQQDRRSARTGLRTLEIRSLSAKGFSVQELSPFQFRIDGALDLYPVHRRYHVLNGDRRGTYQNALGFCLSVLRKAQP